MMLTAAELAELTGYRSPAVEHLRFGDIYSKKSAIKSMFKRIV